MRFRIAPQSTTVTLCALCILITLAHSTTSPHDGGLWARIGHFTDSSAFDVWNGRHYPLFSNMFLHSDFTQGLGITHLLFDVIWLYQLGCLVEVAVGPLWYILFIVASAMIGSCAEIAWSGNIGIGASGVVYALFGLMWAGRFRYPDWQVLANTSNLWMMIGWGVFCIITTALHMMSIANGAHFGGLLFGYSVGMLFFARQRRWVWVAPLVALLGICVMSLTYLPWSDMWLWWKAEKAFDAHNYPQAADYYRRSISHGGPAADGWYNISAAWNNQAGKDEKAGNTAALMYDLKEEAAASAKSAGHS